MVRVEKLQKSKRMIGPNFPVPGERGERRGCKRQ
jgi:hypothetical protein